MVPLPSVSVFNLAPLLTPGACAATAILDQSSGNLYVANLGDCRVLAGWCDPKTGSWRYEQLSEDQTSENPKEQARSVNLDSNTDSLTGLVPTILMKIKTH